MNLIAEPDQITPGFWVLAGALVLIPMVLVAVVPRRWLWRAVLGWLLLPLGVMATGFVLLMLVGAGDPSASAGNALLGIGYIGIFVLVPWLVVAGIGIAADLLVRSVFRRDAKSATIRAAMASPPATPPTPAPVPLAAAQGSPNPSYCGMTTTDLHRRVSEMARQHGWTERLLPISYARDHDTPYVYVDQDGFKFAIYDRGQAHGQRHTRDLDEMLYWVADEVTFHMASEEVARGISHYDEFAPRLLARQESMLAALDPQWHQRWLGDAACYAAVYRREAKTS